MEIISPGGFERLFRELSALGEPTADAIAELGARYGVDVDFEATMPVVERHGLTEGTAGALVRFANPAATR